MTLLAALKMAFGTLVRPEEKQADYLAKLKTINDRLLALSASRDEILDSANSIKELKAKLKARHIENFVIAVNSKGSGPIVA